MKKDTSGKGNILFVILDIRSPIEGNAVFQSQVVDQAIALAMMRYSVSIITVYEDINSFQTKVGEKLKSAGVEYIVRQNKSLLENIIQLSFAVRKYRKSRPVFTGYVRGIWGVLPILFASPFRTLPYVYDVRGDLLDEARFRKKSKFRVKLLDKFESIGIRKATNITTVSTQLGCVVLKRFNLSKMPLVIPSCINVQEWALKGVERKEIRSKLGYNKNDVVCVYSGGTAPYQMLGKMFELWKKMVGKSDNLKWLVLSNTDKNEIIAGAGGIEKFGRNIKILSVPRKDVALILNACDIGFLLRDNLMLNTVASPVKFSEYISAGLTVVSTPWLGDVSRDIRESEVGLLLKLEDLEHDSSVLLNFTKERFKNTDKFRVKSLALARSKYDWSVYSLHYRELYG